MPNSILEDVDKLIDSELDLKDIGADPQYQHKTSCRQLTKPPMTGFKASDLIAKIYEKVVENWDASIYHEGSEENWRLEKQKGISANNNSSEVSLERAIVNIPSEIWPDAANWFNQVPVASGLVDPHEGGRRVDLVHDCGDKAYEFIELKVDSNTPLYAAMEILKYGVLYIFCRQDDRVSKCINRKGGPIIDRERKLMRAEKIHLKVLAPAKYYEGYDLLWLEDKLNNGLAKFLAQPKFMFKLEMDFKFETLSLILTRCPVWKAPG